MKSRIYCIKNKKINHSKLYINNSTNKYNYIIDYIFAKITENLL